MGKKIPCKVIIHGRRREIPWGTFDSIAEAKRSLIYMRQPYIIKPL